MLAAGVLTTMAACAAEAPPPPPAPPLPVAEAPAPPAKRPEAQAQSDEWGILPDPTTGNVDVYQNGKYVGSITGNEPPEQDPPLPHRVGPPPPPWTPR